jgi:DNA-directed RNA polymerase specialized sigma24 family protein
MSPSTDSTPEALIGAEDPHSRRLTEPTAPGREEDGALLLRAIGRAKEGDLRALHLLYVRYADDVRGCAQSIVRSRQAAEAVTQGLFAELTTVIGSYEQREMPFSAWIRRLARIAARDHLRGRQMSSSEGRRSENGHREMGFERSRAHKAELA